MVVVSGYEQLPSYRHPPNDCPSCFEGRGKEGEIKRVGEGGRRVEEALGDVGCAFSISETLRVSSSFI